MPRTAVIHRRHRPEDTLARCGALIDPVRFNWSLLWVEVNCPDCLVLRASDPPREGPAFLPPQPLISIGDPVRIEWTDACTSYGWHSIENHDPKPSQAITVGLLVKDEPDFVSVAQSYSIETDNYAEVQSIPRGMVKTIEALLR